MRLANIGPREIARRRAFGLASLGGAALLALILLAAGASRWTRLLLFVPLWMAGLGLFQAREKT